MEKGKNGGLVKFCANCGSELKEGTKFCSKCGHLVVVASSDNHSQEGHPQVKEAAPSTENLKKNASNLWNWVQSVFKRPDKVAEVPAWYSWLAIALVVLFGAIGAGKMIANQIQSLTGSLGSLMSTFGGLTGNNYSSVTANIGDMIFGKLIMPIIISFIIFHAAVLLSAWLSNNIVLANKDYSFPKMINYYGRLYLLLLPLTVVSMLFALVGVNNIAGFFAFLGISLLGFIITYPYFVSEHHRDMDNIYIKLLAYLVNVVILVIAFLIIYAIMKQAIGGLLGNIGGNISSLLGGL